MARPRASQRGLALRRAALTLLFLAGCASGPRGGSGIGRDGADANPPAGLSQVPDAEPRVEAIRSSGGTSKPYVVLGRSYVPITDDRPFRETGLASWYGRKFHSQSTASGEPYDMYAMTAAHKTLPLPSYVRVRNPANGREAIVRVNDRGPFHDDRVIDLSYTAALKLDLLRGVAPVEIERITNEDIRAGSWRRGDAGGARRWRSAVPRSGRRRARPPTASPCPRPAPRRWWPRRARKCGSSPPCRRWRPSRGAARARPQPPVRGIARAAAASGSSWAPSASATARALPAAGGARACPRWRRAQCVQRARHLPAAGRALCLARTGARHGRAGCATACSSRRVIVERR